MTKRIALIVTDASPLITLAVADAIFGGLVLSELVFKDLIFRKRTSRCLEASDPIFSEPVFSEFMATLPICSARSRRESPNADCEAKAGRIEGSWPPN